MSTDKSLLSDLISGQKPAKIIEDLEKLATPHNLEVVENMVKHHDANSVLHGLADIGAQVALPQKSSPMPIPQPKKPGKKQNKSQ